MSKAFDEFYNNLIKETAEYPNIFDRKSNIEIGWNACLKEVLKIHKKYDNGYAKDANALLEALIIEIQKL
ncbi:MAG: hypothetical protein AABY22_26080 [Nanoarchaeota archaeon]